MAKKIKFQLLKLWMKILTLALSMLGITLTSASCMYEPYGNDIVAMYMQPIDEDRYEFSGKIINQDKQPVKDLELYAHEEDSTNDLSGKAITGEDGFFYLKFYNNSDFKTKNIIIQINDIDGASNGSYSNMGYKVVIDKTKYVFRNLEITIK